MSDTILTAENLKFRYDAEQPVYALDGVSAQVKRGEFVAVLGANGCGKSTLAKHFNAILLPESGKVYVEGIDTADEKKLYDIRLTVGMVFQNPDNQIVATVVEEDVAFALENLGVPQDEMRRRVDDSMKMAGIYEYRERAPHNLSGGQQQRVAIARSLVNEPEILLLDEPLGALDLKLRKEMQLELKRLQREMNITFIYVTHDQEEALTMSDTVVVMNGGKVQQIGTPEDIYNEPKNAFVADFIGDSNIVDGVMHKDFLVSFSGVDFPCVDRGFAREQSVQVVVRPEDIEVVSPMEGQLVGVVNDVIFKGVHFEMHVECEGREWLIHSTRACTPGETIGMRIGPNEIHIMARSEG